MFTMGGKKSTIMNVIHFIGDFCQRVSFWRLLLFLLLLQLCSVTFSQRLLYFVTSSDDVLYDLMLQKFGRMR